MAASATDAADACNSSMGQRSAFVVEAARLIKESPILGHGAGGFYYENKKWTTKSITRTTSIYWKRFNQV